jgi:hypothetical protein
MKVKHPQSFLMTIFLFFLIIFTITPSISATMASSHQIMVNEKNQVDLNKISFFRVYVIGKIYNLTFGNGTYIFQTDNLRIFKISRDYFGTFEISYEHILDKNSSYGMSGGFKFRGVLTSTFICGFFYIPQFMYWHGLINKATAGALCK